MLATAPIAAPVVAQEAAGKMGLSSWASAAVSGDQYVSKSWGATPQAAGGDEDWIRSRFDEFWSEEGVEIRHSQSRHEARTLDPDLASMRSISPSFAYSVQRSRVKRDIERRELGWIEKSANKLGISLFKRKS